MDLSEKHDQFRGCIYIFTNLYNQKQYIGQTWNIKRRLREHFAGYGYAKLLKRAIEKYGKNGFETKVIYYSDNQIELNEKEIHFIKLFRSLAPNGYNLALGGASGNHSDETKKLIGSYHIGKLVSIETRNKLSKALKGKVLSQETIEKIRITKSISKINKIKPIYIFNCITHKIFQKFQNTFKTESEMNIPLKRVYYSICNKSSFLYKKIHCYARYEPIPLDKTFSFGRIIGVTFNDLYSKKYISVSYGTKELNLKRGVLDGLIRKKYMKSKYIDSNNNIGYITAKYLTVKTTLN